MRGAREPSGLLRDVVFGVEHDAFTDDVGAALLRAWSLGVCNEGDWTANLIHGRVDRLRVSEAFGELSPFRVPHLSSGEVNVGSGSGGELVWLLVQLFNAGLLLVGNTGSGKSNLLKQLLLQLGPRLDGFWCTDMYKTEMRHLGPLLRGVGVDLVVLPASKQKVNLLQPDGGSPLEHVPVVRDILRRHLGIPPRALAIVDVLLISLYAEFGNIEGKTNAWPTLFDLYERARSTKSLNSAAREAILDRIGAFLVSLTPSVGAWRLGWRPSDLKHHAIIFEFSTAGERVKSAIADFYLSSLLRSGVRENRPNSGMKFLCVFEDAQRFASAGTEAGGDITPMEELAGLIRGTGVGLVFLVQSLSGLPKGLLANLATKCMCRLGHHEDYRALGADMGMNADQIRWAQLNLRPGVSLWSLAEGSHRLPFVLHTPRVDMPARVDDSEVTSSQRPLDRLPTVFANEFARWSPVPLVEISNTPTTSVARLTEVESRFLQSVMANPGQPCSACAKAAGLSGRRAAEVRQRLVQAGYVREHSVATGKRGRTAIVLEVLEPALELLPATGEPGR